MMTNARNILGSHSTRHGENAVAHRCFHSSAISSCRMCTKPPVLHDRACSIVILAPQPSQALSISSEEWFYRSLTLSLHSSANRPVPFNRLGKPKARHSFICPFSPQMVCLGFDSRGRSAHFGVNLVKPPSLPQWRRHDEAPGQTDAGHPRLQQTKPLQPAWLQSV